MGVKFQNIKFDLDKLPTMPLVAAQMMELINAPETSAAALAKVVSKDPAVSARVLKIANSSFYSMSRQVSSLSTAIVILGEKTLKNLVLAASMRSMNQTFGKIEQMLWEDSMVCALGSRYLARKLGVADPEEAFMAGLFRHIGLVVLNNQESKAADFIIKSMESGKQSMAEEERELFGATHAEIGAAVLESWKLSEVLSLVALHHSDVTLDDGADSSAINLTSVVNIAGLLPGYFGIYGGQHKSNLEKSPGRKLLALDLQRTEKIIEEFHSIFEENRNDFLS
ncbi:MAG: HDOD domain-containing protein [Desulfuromusa sp.]|nr:HDOD domain-containing protein [Desulfuromusa sp.]